MRHYYFKPVLTLFDFQMRLDQIVVVYERVFNVKNAPVLRKSGKQMLRALPHKVPVQVREAHEIG